MTLDEFVKTVFYWKLPRSYRYRQIFEWFYGDFRYFESENNLTLELLPSNPPEPCPRDDTIVIERWPYAMLSITTSCDCDDDSKPDDMLLTIQFKYVERGNHIDLLENWYSNESGLIFPASGKTFDYCCNYELLKEPPCHTIKFESDYIQYPFITIRNFGRALGTIIYEYPNVTIVGEDGSSDLFTYWGACSEFECVDLDFLPKYSSYSVNVNNEITHLYEDFDGFTLRSRPKIGSEEWLDLNNIDPQCVDYFEKFDIVGREGYLSYFVLTWVYLLSACHPGDSAVCGNVLRVYTKECNQPEPELCIPVIYVFRVLFVSISAVIKEEFQEPRTIQVNEYVNLVNVFELTFAPNLNSIIVTDNHDSELIDNKYVGIQECGLNSYIVNGPTAVSCTISLRDFYDEDQYTLSSLGELIGANSCLYYPHLSYTYNLDGSFVNSTEPWLSIPLSVPVGSLCWEDNQQIAYDPNLINLDPNYVHRVITHIGGPNINLIDYTLNMSFTGDYRVAAFEPSMLGPYDPEFNPDLKSAAVRLKNGSQCPDYPEDFP